MAELQEHFRFDYKKILPKSGSIIKGQKYRITILSPVLVRLEYSETGMFEDRPTEFAINRNFPTCEFDRNEDEKFLTIKTKYFSLSYQKEMPFVGTKVSPDQYLRINLEESDKFWYFNHPEVRVKDFGGQTYSLDGADGKFKLSKGLYTTDGFVSIDDSKSLIFNEDGSMGKRSDNRIDTYVFLYRRDFGSCLHDYFTLTGYPPLIPRYALGVWWNRSKQYNSKDIENLVFQFNKHRVPVSIFALGNGWHRQNPKMPGGLSFDEQLFKRPKRMADFLHSRNIRLALAVNPMDGISPKEDYYLPFKAASGAKDEGVIPFNVFSKDIVSAYLDYLIHPLMNYGVDFFWIDYNNPNDLAGLRALEHYHFDDFKQIQNRRGIILGRNGMIAAHKYPVIYTGRTKVSWANLEMMPEFNASAANMGLTWISNDIGGYYDGTEDGELFSRFVQFGCFSPILRLAADSGKYYKREPWKWDITTQSVVSEYLRLRHQLIPYLYSEAYRYHKTGIPLVQPLYYRYPEIFDEPLYKNEYYFGTSLFIAPITTKMVDLMNRTIQKIYLPEGTWYNFTTGKRYTGGKRYTTFYKQEEYPVFARAGSVIPLTLLDEKNLNDTSSPKDMEIHVFPGASSTYELYEDDGISSLFEKDFYIVTDIDFSYQKNNLTVIIRPVAGKSGIIPKFRHYRIRFRNIREPDDVIIHIGKEKVKGAATYTDENDFVVELPSLSTVKQITINCKGKDIEIDAARLLNDDIDNIISDLPIPTNMKETIGGIMLGDLDIRKKRIEVRKLSKYGINQKYINLFLKLLEYMAEV